MGGGNMGGSGGRGGVVPFRAGDWKCGNETCAYHNFAKNINCLRCGSSRSNAAVIADNGAPTFPNHSYGGPPNMPPMQSMGPGSYGSMPQPPPNYGGNGMPGPPGDFGGQSFGPPSTYALPSGIAGQNQYMGGGYPPHMGGNHAGAGQGGFDSRAEQAFNQGNSGGPPQGGQQQYANGHYNAVGNNSNNSNNNAGNNAGYGNGGENGGDPFSFLSSGMNNLGINESDSRRGGGQNNAKSPQ
jgi:hypothetical protein